jgi:amino acid transporter
LALGTIAVAAIYMLTNVAFIAALGIGGMARSEAVAADVLALRFGSAGARTISLLICISCLGAIHSMLFTGARVYYALGSENPLFAWLGEWNQAKGVPFRSLAIQTAVTAGMVVAFGLYQDGFDRLVVFSGPFFWGFIALVGLALIVLRRRDGSAKRVYRVPLYPLTPLVLVVSSGLMVYATAAYALSNLAWEASWAAIVVLVGLVVMVWTRERAR